MSDITVKYLADDGTLYRMSIDSTLQSVLPFEQASDDLPILPAQITPRFVVARSGTDWVAIPAPSPMAASVVFGTSVTINGTVYTFSMVRGESALGIFTRQGSLAAGPPGPPGQPGINGSGGGSAYGDPFDPSVAALQIPWGSRISLAGSTTWNCYGFAGLTNQGTVTNADDSDGMWMQFDSPSDDWGGTYYPNPFTRFDAKPITKVRAKLGPVANLKQFFFTLAPWVEYIWRDNTSANGCGIRFNPATDSNIVFWTSDSANNANEIDTGVPYVEGNFHTFAIDISDSTNFKGWIDGAAFQSSFHLPDLSPGVFFGIGAMPVAGGPTVSIKIGGFAGVTS